MAELLRGMGLRPCILNSDPTPRIYEFLCRRGEPRRYSPDADRRRLQEADLVVLLDANYWDRAGAAGEALSRLSVPSLGLDHHVPRGRFATVQIAEPSASSTSELVYELALHLESHQSRRFREAIYAGILYDTGNFRFSNTGPRAHEIVAALLKDGVSAPRMYERLFESGTLARMQLFGLALQTLRAECQGRLAWFTISREMFDRTGALPEDVDGFVDWVRSIRDAQLILMFRDHEGGRVKGSFRSKTAAFDVNRLAHRFGGGGHQRAAGATMPGPLEDAAARVVREARKLIR